MANLVKMKITRRYPRGGITYGVGAVISVPEAAAKVMEEARPPFGQRVQTSAPQTRTGDATTPPKS